MFLAIVLWVLNYLADTNSQEKVEESLDLAVALSDLNDDTVSDDEILDDFSIRSKQRQTPSDDINANVPEEVTDSEFEKISKEMAQMDLSFQERVVTKHSSCDFSSRNDYDEDSSPEDSELNMGGQIATICEEDEDVTVLKVERHVEHRVFEIQNSKPKKYKTDEFTKRLTEDESDDGSSSAEQHSTAKVVIECVKCKRSFGLDIISQHIQFCKNSDELGPGKAQRNDADGE